MPSKKISKKSSRKARVSRKTARKSAKKSAARISPETVMKVARIARLHLSDDEAKKLAKDLNDVLKAFKELDKAPAGGVEPSFQPLLVKDVFREDVVEESISNEEALANTKHKENKFFKGPRAV